MGEGLVAVLNMIGRQHTIEYYSHILYSLVSGVGKPRPLLKIKENAFTNA